MHVLEVLAVRTLQQCQGLLERITQAQYIQRSTQPPHSTISKHVRHTLERFQVFVGGVKSDEANVDTLLDFDVVEKNRAIEWDIDAARYVLSNLITFFDNGLVRQRLYRQVRLTIHTPTLVILNSTYARELHFVIVHAIHHYALIRAIAAGELHVGLDDGFGHPPRHSKM
ncbi:hypothetical protein E3P84_03874 [Wallemia ichthyophaga]|nr:hypothetical protein E3P84_03874 [Wallemia ichthyophaga]TIB38688.1 hypothetical protein E3P83_03880 [Wallemia ichthyophaga]